MKNETMSEYYSRLYTPEQLKAIIEEKQNLLDGLKAHKIPASRIIGKALKAPRKQAEIYLVETIRDYTAALELHTKG